MIKASHKKTSEQNSQRAVNVTKIGNFNRSSQLHSSYVGSQFAIIVQSDESSGGQAKYVCDYIKESLQYFINQMIPEAALSEKLSEAYHKKRMTNFVVSCREFIEKNKYHGFFSFCFFYKIEKAVFCLKTIGLEMYYLDIINKKIVSLADSKTFPFRLSQQQQSKGYMHFGMDKIKPQLMLEDETQLSFSHFILSSDNDNFKLLMGSSECFAVANPQYIIKHFDGSKKSLWEATDDLLEEVKKKWRKIYQKDITFICSQI